MLGLSVAEAEDLTPVELVAMQHQFKQRLEIENHRFGMVCASIYNSQRATADAHFFQPSEFFASPSSKETGEDHEMTEEYERNRAQVLDDMFVDIKTRSKIERSRAKG